MSRIDRIVARAGKSTVEVDNSDVMRIADRITNGAVSTFIQAARRQADPIAARVRNEKHAWTDKTGRSRPETIVVERIKNDEVSVSVVNPVPYVYKVRYSVMTPEQMDEEASQVANSTWAELGPKVERGTTSKARRAIARKHIEEASDGLLRGWWWGADPSARSIRDLWRRRLKGLHGVGAPNEQLAGKHLWGTQVRRPMRKGEAQVIADSREALDRLAEG